MDTGAIIGCMFWWVCLLLDFVVYIVLICCFGCWYSCVCLLLFCLLTCVVWVLVVVLWLLLLVCYVVAGFARVT